MVRSKFFRNCPFLFSYDEFVKTVGAQRMSEYQRIYDMTQDFTHKDLVRAAGARVASSIRRYNGYSVSASHTEMSDAAGRKEIGQLMRNYESARARQRLTL